MQTLTILPRFLLITGILGMLMFSSAEAQVAGKVLSTKAADTNEGNDITISAEITPSVDIAQFFLFYRQYGQSEFHRVEMTYRTTTATGVIPGSNVAPPFVEYYISLQLKNEATETYPLQNPDANPLRVTVLGRSEKDREVIILSPEKNEQLSMEDFFISISLIYASSNVDKNATRLFIDDIDVTANAVFSNDVLTYFPDNFPGTLSSGTHSYRVELRTPSGAQYHTVKGSFSVIPKGVTAAEKRAFKYGVSVQAEARNEDINDIDTWYNRLTLRLNGGWPSATFNSYIHLTSEEKEYRQPQNRYSFSGETSWLKVGLGDVYPVFPNLILNGQRVRGVSGNLLLGAFNLDVAYGELIRSIEGNEITRYNKNALPSSPDSLLNLQRLSGADSNYYAQYSYGTFKRNLFAIRPSFGKGENFRIGFNYLHSIDDKNSIKHGAKPEENVVMGSDLLFGLDNQRFLITAQAAISIVNTDITSGDASDSTINSLFGPGKPYGGDPETIKNVRKWASPFITVNENISPLDPLKTGSLAYEAALSLNYFGNYLKASYVSRGGEYHSFGQLYLRTDIQGFNLIDRLRLLENTLFLAGNIELLSDNLKNTKPATTNFSNYNFSVSYYPRINFPYVTVGVGGYGNNNNLNVDSSSAVDNMTFRFFTQMGYDFTYYARHSASLSVSTFSTDDRTPAKMNTKNTVIAAGVTTTYKVPLQTSVNLTFNFNTFPSSSSSVSTEYNYTTLMFNGVYRLLQEKLRVGATLSPTFCDMKRTLVELTSQYMFTQQQSLSFQLYLINNPDNSASKNDIIASLVYRLDL